jgi:UDP-N-acetylglucosamine 2-epimerase
MSHIVLVMRDNTERPEAIAADVARLVGTDPQRIIASVTQLLADPAAYEAMAQPANPYGDGHAAQRTLAAIDAMLSKQIDGQHSGIRGYQPRCGQPAAGGYRIQHC